MQVGRLVPLRDEINPALEQISATGRASGVSFGSQFSTMLPLVLAIMARMSAMLFSLLAFGDEGHVLQPDGLGEGVGALFQIA